MWVLKSDKSGAQWQNRILYTRTEETDQCQYPKVGAIDERDFEIFSRLVVELETSVPAVNGSEDWAFLTVAMKRFYVKRFDDWPERVNRRG